MGDTSTTVSVAPTRLPIRVMLVFTLALVVLGGLRFARVDLPGSSFFATDDFYTWDTADGRHIEHLNIDISQYLAMVENFRGIEGTFEKQEPYPDFAASAKVYEGPVQPFTHRVALPWLASLVPLDSSFAFALVNLVLIVIGLWFLVDAIATTGRSPTAQATAAALYTFAVPVLVYTSALFIDGGVVGVLVIGYWLMVRRYWIALVAFFPIAYLVKVALLVLAPAVIWAWRVERRSFRDPRFIAGVATSVVGVLAAMVWVSSTAPESVFAFTMMPTWTFFRFNVTNPVSAIYFVLSVSTVVVPAILGLRYMLRKEGLNAALDGPSGPDIVGFASVSALNLYSIASTDLTVRNGWLIWPFAIALTAVWVDRKSSLPDRFNSRLAGSLN